jgi:hypothetical protein
VVPASVRRAGAGFVPRPEGTNRPTLGQLTPTAGSLPTNPAGEQLSGHPGGQDLGRRLESGGRDRSLADDLRHDPLRGPPVTFYQHVEAKAAAAMRREQLRDAELVLDNTVCGSTDRDRSQPWACHAILPSILPLGARLRVWVTRDGGRTWWQTTYRGTGERIQS